MDPIYVKGLREAKAAVDAGTLSAEEFEKEKKRLLAQREEREKEAQVCILHSEHGNSDLGTLLRMIVHLLRDSRCPPLLHVCRQQMSGYRSGP